MNITVDVYIQDNGFRKKSQRQVLTLLQWQLKLYALRLDWMAGASTALYTPLRCDCRKPIVIIDEFPQVHDW